MAVLVVLRKFVIHWGWRARLDIEKCRVGVRLAERREYAEKFIARAAEVFARLLAKAAIVKK